MQILPNEYFSGVRQGRYECIDGNTISLFVWHTQPSVSHSTQSLCCSLLREKKRDPMKWTNNRIKWRLSTVLTLYARRCSLIDFYMFEIEAAGNLSLKTRCCRCSSSAPYNWFYHAFFYTLWFQVFGEVKWQFWGRFSMSFIDERTQRALTNRNQWAAQVKVNTIRQKGYKLYAQNISMWFRNDIEHYNFRISRGYKQKDYIRSVTLRAFMKWSIRIFPRKFRSLILMCFVSI